MSEVAISADTQMQEIESSLPGARRALFQRYHVGGCSSCGFQPTDTLKQVERYPDCTLCAILNPPSLRAGS